MHARIDAFVAELTKLVREATYERLAAALEHSPGGRGVERRGPGAKRTSDEIEAQAASILAFLRKNPGARAEAIASHLGTPSRSLTLALKRLLATRQITRKGQKRATRYFPA